MEQDTDYVDAIVTVLKNDESFVNLRQAIEKCSRSDSLVFSY